MKTIRFAKNFMLLNVIYSIIYNTWFGWNMSPINDNEKLYDNIFIIISSLSCITYFLPLLSLYENAIKKLDDNENI